MAKAQNPRDISACAGARAAYETDLQMFKATAAAPWSRNKLHEQKKGPAGLNPPGPLADRPLNPGAQSWNDQCLSISPLPELYLCRIRQTAS